MRRIFLMLAAVSIALTFNACCCGDEFAQGFNEGFNGSVAEEYKTMDRMMGSVEDSPQKSQVQRLLDKGQKDAIDGKVGAIKTGIFKESFMRAIADDKFSKAETKDLKKLYKEAQK